MQMNADGHSCVPRQSKNQSRRYIQPPMDADSRRWLMKRSLIGVHLRASAVNKPEPLSHEPPMAKPHLHSSAFICGSHGSHSSIPQLVPLDLARRGFGKLVQELDAARVFVTGQARAYELLQFG